jgi:hypothetical protein
MRSWKTPTPEQVSKALALLGHAEQYRYFFDRLENPLWIGPLREHKFFQNPAAIIHDKERGIISFPPWPESRYLARMAPLASFEIQQTILEILLQIKTENVSVHEDIVETAAGLHPELSTAFSKKEAAWIKTQSHIFGLLPEKLGKLIEHLGQGGSVDEALNLARTVFEVLPNPKPTKQEDENVWTWKPDPVSRLEKWDYAVISKKLINLVPIAGHQLLEMFCDLLETAINLSRRRDEQVGPEDYSYIWRRGIEHSHHNYAIKEVLVSRVRDIADQNASLNPSQVSAIIQILEGRRWLVFKRISLHVLKISPHQAKRLIVERILDKANFDERGLWHEYIGLVHNHFDDLTPEQQAQLLNWIETERTPESVKATHERWDGTVLSDEEADKRIKAWKVRRLKPIYDVIPADWKQRFDEWEKETGVQQETDYVTPAPQIRFGLESPKTREELQEMSVEEIAAFLGKWQRSDDSPIGASPEGLGRELTARIAAEPARFAEEAELFVGLDPTYVRHLLSALRDAAKQKNQFSWQAVLRLCIWVVHEPNEMPSGRQEYREQDVGWTDSRATIADLLSAGLESSASEIPFELRAEVWNILMPLTDDFDPTPEQDDRWRTSGGDDDALTLSVNSTRGEAMHALMRYALWVQRHHSRGDETKQQSSTFEIMPEVRDVLTRHLDPTADPSPAVRAVYGSWLPWLISLDPNWTTDSFARIFPDGEELKELRDAAWDTYVGYNDAYNDIFGVLREEYVRAVNRIGEKRAVPNRHRENPDERLSEHLMLFYGRGIEDSEELLTQFFEKASDELCAHALWFVGETLSGEIPAEVLTRFQTLWERRLEKSRESPGSHKHELIAFGALFSSKSFAEDWAIIQLKNSLQISGWSEPDHKVVEYLAELSERFPKDAVDCLAIMVEGDKDGWRVQFWSEHVRNILMSGLGTPDRETREIAEAMVHRLGAQGHWQFRDLIPAMP